MPDVNKRYFESLMQAKDLSLRALAKRMGMSHSQLSLTFSGDRKMQLDEVAQLSSIFGEPIHRIVENAGVLVRSLNHQRVSVIAVMNGDGTVSTHPEGVIERTSSPEALPEDGIGIQCRTSGSALEWMDGWVFFCSKPTGVDSAVPGRFAYCQIKDGPACMASVRRGYQDKSLNLRGPFNADSVSLAFAAPVLFSRL